jgi:hypothetical protein
MWCLKENAQGAQTRNVGFIETVFNNLRHFVVLRYSATKFGLLSDNRYYFYGNTVEVNRVYE